MFNWVIIFINCVFNTIEYSGLSINLILKKILKKLNCMCYRVFKICCLLWELNKIRLSLLRIFLILICNLIYRWYDIKYR